MIQDAAFGNEPQANPHPLRSTSALPARRRCYRQLHRSHVDYCDRPEWSSQYNNDDPQGLNTSSARPARSREGDDGVARGTQRRVARHQLANGMTPTDQRCHRGTLRSARRGRRRLLFYDDPR
jgi:hypothetical protein